MEPKLRNSLILLAVSVVGAIAWLFGPLGKPLTKVERYERKIRSARRYGDDLGHRFKAIKEVSEEIAADTSLTPAEQHHLGDLLSRETARMAVELGGLPRDNPAAAKRMKDYI